MSDVRAALGPISILHWNAYAGGAGDLTTAPVEELRAPLDVSVFGLLAAVQAALPDLKSAKGAVLVTGGGLGFYDPKVDAMAVQWGAMGLAVAKGAQHKTVGLLHQKLAADGVYAADVVVLRDGEGHRIRCGQRHARALGDRPALLGDQRAPHRRLGHLPLSVVRERRERGASVVAKNKPLVAEADWKRLATLTPDGYFSLSTEDTRGVPVRLFLTQKLFTEAEPTLYQQIVNATRFPARAWSPSPPTPTTATACRWAA